VANPTRGGVDLDERLEPQEAARPDPRHLEASAALRAERRGDLVRAERQRARIARDVDARRHLPFPVRAVSASRRSGGTRPCSWPPTRTDGPQAQLPRQYTASRDTAPSGVVPWKSTPRLRLACSASASPPTA